MEVRKKDKRSISSFGRVAETKGFKNGTAYAFFKQSQTTKFSSQTTTCLSINLVLLSSQPEMRHMHPLLNLLVLREAIKKLTVRDVTKGWKG